jgi:RNA polymerase sigma-70 factor (ECF subfamily)
MSSPVLSDAADEITHLVLRMQQGDARAFASLYERHVRLVEVVVRDNVHDPESIADVTQEVFTRLLERVSSLRDPARFRPWLLSIARHAAIDHRRRRLNAPAIVEQTTEVTADGPGPAELAELAELASLVRGCVAGLSSRDLTAVAMVTYLGFSSSEVAAALGTTTNAAKVTVHRARARLRQALGLQLLAKSRAVDCPTLTSLRTAGDLLGAARHTDRCDVCAAAVEAEVSAYDHDRSPIAETTVRPRLQMTSTHDVTISGFERLV